MAKFESTFHFAIRYSSVKQLRVDIPAELAGRIRNETPTLSDRTMAPAPDDLAADYVAWTLTGETELMGQVQCKLTWETAIDQLGIGQSVDLPVPRLIPRGVDRTDGQIVLVKAETIDVEPKGQPVGLDPIDPQQDLVAGATVPDAAAALEFHDAWQLVLTATRYQLETLRQTSIERAVLRKVITRSDRVSVQALYRLRSNRQRLRIQLPGEVSAGEAAAGQIDFDADPLRINGRRVTLERGADSKTFFVPLAGRDAGQPMLLELRYTAPGSGQNLQYPVFPDDPAVQIVHMVVYVPEEWVYLGSRGPWTDECLWRRAGPLLGRVPVPRVDVGQLTGMLTTGIDVAGNPLSDFPTDGRPLLFSTLHPADPVQGALRLSLLDRRVFYGAVFGIVLLGGLLLLARPAADRVVASCGLLAVLLLVGGLLPTLASALVNNVLILAAVLVGLLWLAVFVIGGLPIGRRDKWHPYRDGLPGPAVDLAASPASQTAAADQTNPADASEPGPPPGQQGGQPHV